MALPVAGLIASNQFGVIEIISGVHAHALGEAPAHGDFLVLVEQRDLHPVDFAGVRVDDADGRVHGLVVVGRTPVSGQGRIKHLTQPVNDHRLAHLRQDAVVDFFVIGRRLGDPCQRAAGHKDDPATEFFYRRELFFVGAQDIIEAARVLDSQLVGACATRQQGSGQVSRRVGRAADQFERCRPVKSHAALRRVHRLGHAKAQRPEMAAVGDGGVPVDGGVKPGVLCGEWVGHHVCGGVGYPGKGARRSRGKIARHAQLKPLKRAPRRRQVDAQCGSLRRIHCCIPVSTRRD